MLIPSKAHQPWHKTYEDFRVKVRQAATLQDIKAAIDGRPGVKRLRRRSHIGSLVDRFWANVIKGETEDDCWGWQSTTMKGYGAISLCELPILAHRLSLMISNGRIDPSLDVLHSCDNPICANPRHLHQGTHADNMKEAVARGRTDNGAAKVTPSDVQEIRRRRWAGESLDALSSEFGVNRGSISLIALGRIWRRVPWTLPVTPPPPVPRPRAQGAGRAGQPA